LENVTGKQWWSGTSFLLSYNEEVGTKMPSFHEIVFHMCNIENLTLSAVSVTIMKPSLLTLTHSIMASLYFKV
jgi:hypothetical protein